MKKGLTLYESALFVDKKHVLSEHAFAFITGMNYFKKLSSINVVTAFKSPPVASYTAI